jgi:hypothetical protein
MLSLLSDGFVPAATNFRHAPLSSAFHSLRQAATSSASGICALQSLNASGVQACRASAVPCAIDLAGEAITDTKAGSRHHRLSGFSRRCIHSSSLAFTGRFLPSALNGILMICTDTVSSYFAIVQKRPRLKPICKELVAALAQEAAVCARRTQVAATLRRNTPAFATAAIAKLRQASQSGGSNFRIC